MKVNPEMICESWKETTGTVLNAERVREHVAALSEWANRRPETIRYMDREQLANLRREIIDALLAQGTTRERAKELVASLPTVGDRLQVDPDDS
jgi:hypothetical protein